jgi:hypothetical protein
MNHLYRRETTSFDCLSTERKATIDPERIADDRSQMTDRR